MKKRIYIDTSVIGGCYDDEFKLWSDKLFQEIRIGKKIAVISDITLKELEEAPGHVRNVLVNIPKTRIEYVFNDPDSESLADLYIREGAVTKKYKEDALHIALATINHADVLVSWNFTHIVNLDRIRKYNAVNLKYGFPMLEIRNPREVIDEDFN